MSGVNDIRRTEVEREEGDERTRLSHERRKRERQEKWRGPWPLAPSSRRSFSRFVSSSCRFLMSSVPYHPRPSLTSPYPPHRRNGVT